jgi:hypothetical protein
MLLLSERLRRWTAMKGRQKESRKIYGKLIDIPYITNTN